VTGDIPDEIHGLLDRMSDAWDAGDAARFAACFCDDASFVIWRGDALLGRRAIERAHAGLFRNNPGRLHVRVTDHRRLSAVVAVLLTVAGTGSGEVVLDKVQTLTLARNDGEWLVAAFQNTQIAEAAA
jgi:uncharacterized protein (TIGR02246 family)